MASNCLSFNNSQEQAYELAYNLAREQLASMGVEELCHKAGAQCVDSNKIIIEYLNRPYLVTLSHGEITLRDSEEQVPLKDKILILHYLVSARGTPSTNKLITYKQLPGGASYFPAFYQRAIKPVLNHFGRKPELLMATAAKLGGHKASYADVSVTINAFPRVPVTIGLWRGDDEVPPGGSIIFDSNISDYLSSEDVTVLCETIAWRLIKNSG